MADDSKGIMKTKPSDLVMNIEKLLNAENPCQWKPVSEPENLNEIDREVVGDGRFSFHNFVIDMISSYNEYEKKNVSKALEIIENLENMINGRKDDSQDIFFERIEEAVKHTVLTMKAALLMRSNKTEECLKVSKSVTSFGDMDANNRAGIHAIRSACEAMYSFEGTRTALSRINMAMKEDAATPYWIFLKATYLQKLRKIQSPNDSPSLEERDLFKEAADKEENPLFMVHLADTLRETAVSNMNRQEKYFWFLPDKKAKDDVKQKTEALCKSSLELYKKSYALKSRCPLIAFRCAYGLMMLPQLYQDVKQAKEILYEMIPKHKTSGFGNLVNALFLNTFGKNPFLAGQYLRTAVELNVFTAHINMIRMRFCEKDPKLDALAELQQMREKFKETPKLGNIVSQCVSYYIFVKYDVKLACEYTLEYFKIPNRGNTLQVHRSCFHSTSEPFSLIDIVTDEVKHTMSNRNLAPDLRTFYQTFVHFMNFENYVVLKGVPQNLLKQILEGKPLKSEPWYNKSNSQTAAKGGKGNAGRSRTNQGEFKPPHQKYQPNSQSIFQPNHTQPKHQPNKAPSKYQPNQAQSIHQPNQEPSKYQPNQMQLKHQPNQAYLHQPNQSQSKYQPTPPKPRYQPGSAPANPRNMNSSQVSPQTMEFFEQFKAAPQLAAHLPQFREHRDQRSPSPDRRSRHKRDSPDGRHRRRRDSAESRRRHHHDSYDSVDSRRRRRRDSDDSADERRRRHRRHRRRSSSSSLSYDSDSSYERRDRRRRHGRRRSYSRESDVSPYRRRQHHRGRYSHDTSSGSSTSVERRRSPSRHRRRDERDRRSRRNRSPSGRSVERDSKSGKGRADAELVKKMRGMKLEGRGADKQGSKRRTEEGRGSSVDSAGSRGRAGKRVQSQWKHREEKNYKRSGRKEDSEDEGECEARADPRDRRKGDARPSGRKRDQETDDGESDSRSSRRGKEKKSPAADERGQRSKDRPTERPAADERGQRSKDKLTERPASEVEPPAKVKAKSDLKTRDHSRSSDDQFEPYYSSSD